MPGVLDGGRVLILRAWRALAMPDSEVPPAAWMPATTILVSAEACAA